MVSRILLVDLDSELVDAWREVFAGEIAEGAIEVRHGSLLDVLTEVDAVLTAGNSYGQMDGGVDRAIAEYWPGVQRFGVDGAGRRTPRLPAHWFRCRRPDWRRSVPLLVYAPTMRVLAPSRNLVLDLSIQTLAKHSGEAQSRPD